MAVRSLTSSSWGGCFPVHHLDFGSMPLTKRFKPAVAKAHKPIFVPNDQTFHMTEFKILDNLSYDFT